MRTKLTIAVITCSALLASPALIAQTKDSKDASAKTEQKKGGLSGQDRKYFQEMAQANMAEVQTGKLAQQKASSEEVKKFAEHMVQDHGKLLQEQQSMAKTKGVSLPKAAEEGASVGAEEAAGRLRQRIRPHVYGADGQGSREDSEDAAGRGEERQGPGSQAGCREGRPERAEAP